MRPFDVIIMMNVLSEIGPSYGDRINKRIKIVSNMADRFLTHDGSLIIIEPAMRNTSKDMLLVRNGPERLYSPVPGSDNGKGKDQSKQRYKDKSYVLNFQDGDYSTPL